MTSSYEFTSIQQQEIAKEKGVCTSKIGKWKRVAMEKSNIVKNQDVEFHIGQMMFQGAGQKFVYIELQWLSMVGLLFSSQPRIVQVLGESCTKNPSSSWKLILRYFHLFLRFSHFHCPTRVVVVWLFFMVPKGYHFTDVGKRSFGLSKIGLHTSKFRVVVVEFDTSLDLEYGDLNGNHISIDVDCLLSIKLCNISSQNMFLNSGKKLDSWINYDASAKSLEVRLCYSGNIKPINLLLFYSIDLSKLWHDTDVFVGLTSSNGNTTQTCSVYSWTFKSMLLSYWLHSQPLDPYKFATDMKTPQVISPERIDTMGLGLAPLFVRTVCKAFLIIAIVL
ncbi:hypothetical protein LWI28_019139 [Acer negundo]|uniref:Legume lectin domain-containing protein n=1 Tax=Acer negundo TaxID=4023 RepID=A0AAD5IMB0_ACENE|nr:hypothetical protein LWI28_019139 [Acer negundo]